MRKTRAPAPRRTKTFVNWATIPLVLDVSMVAVLLDRSESFVRKALQNGELPGGKIGHEWRIDRDKLREKIDLLMRNAKIDTYKDLLIKMYKQLGDNSAYEKAEREKGNFTKMLNGERELNSKYYVPIERIFDMPKAVALKAESTINASLYCTNRLSGFVVISS